MFRNGEPMSEFCSKYFLSQIPPDMEMIPASRTIGQDRVVEEMVTRFTRTIPMDWILPGILPTGKRVVRSFKGGLNDDKG